MTHSSTTKTPDRTTAAYELRRTPALTLGGSSVNETPTPELANLHVGKGLELKGKISSCDSLVIEGNVEAEIESGSLTVSETGQVKGDAQVDEAEIEGLFDGTLEVKGCLIIRATGKVSGTIHYGQLMIDQGGRLIGEVDVNTASEIKTSSTKKTTPTTDTSKPIVAAAE
ncbi:MAG: polymer-forming cytoskeletal protein [Parvibaculaceae bacterium]|nr:polymer-forming cytoskeletal protein [Parvibaculaceae bacterium]